MNRGINTHGPSTFLRSAHHYAASSRYQRFTCSNSSIAVGQRRITKVVEGIFFKHTLQLCFMAYYFGPLLLCHECFQIRGRFLVICAEHKFSKKATEMFCEFKFEWLKRSWKN